MIKRVLLALVLVLGLGSLAWAGGGNSPAKFSIQKNFCLGIPTAMAQPANCPHAGDVPLNTPVFYTFTLSNPIGQPQQAIDLTDQLPSGFSQAANGFYCSTAQGTAVPFTPSSSVNGLAVVTLGVGETVTCFLPGQFTSVGGKNNTVKGTNDDHNDATSGSNTHVLATAPLGTDLAVSKTATPGSLNISNGSGTITYTITITNNGPVAVDVGGWFVLHDNLSLLPNSVPLNGTFVGGGCVSTVGTDCLVPGGPSLSGSNPMLIGTMGPQGFFDWSFPPSSAGHIAIGGSITLTIKLKIDQLAGLDCTAALNANGLHNEAFFTLINNSTNSALYDLNPANNTAAVDTAVDTGQTTVDPHCGKGHLKITKTQINPSNPVAWGQPVEYEITVENASLPHQKIKIDKQDFQDLVTEGVNTPPFHRTYGWTKCLASVPASLCSPFTPGINQDPDFDYTYYGQANQGWDNGQSITLNYADSITFRTEFTYENPDCETVPNANPKPVINTARVHYQASAFGAVTVNPQNANFTQEASAITQMEPQPTCPFVVTKRLRNTPAAAYFNGTPLTYDVSFSNQGPARTVGTVIDVARIADPAYATSIPFTSSWSCTDDGVTNYTATGSLVGSAIYTATPAMGSPTVHLGSNIKFGANTTLTCTVKIALSRPKVDNPHCSTAETMFENLALMDVTSPFNNNIAWPPSSIYNSAALSNPPAQTTNWAMASAWLPRCWDFVINKSASVAGLSGGQPWTFVGNPNPVIYTIKTTNLAQGQINGPNIPGWTVTDNFVPPYNFSMVSFVGCAPGGWCWPGLPHDPRQNVGIQHLNPAGSAGANGYWTLKLPPAQIISGQDIHNTACVKVQGAQAGFGWYENSNPATLCDSASVAVVKLTSITVTKKLVDLTGAGTTAMGPFAMSVNCAPYAALTAQANFTISTNNSGQGSHTVNTVPLTTHCTIAETSLPAIPAPMAHACFGAANVIVSTVYTQPPAMLGATGNTATVTNTYQCKPPAGSKVIKVSKFISGPQLPAGTIIPPLNFVINANCSPTAAVPPSATISQGQTAVFTVTAGSNCTLSEGPMPPIPAVLAAFCNTMNHQIAVWDTPIFYPGGGVSQTSIINQDKSVELKNGWHCVAGLPPAGQIEIIKQLNTIQTPVQFPATQWLINTACNPAATINGALTLTTPASGNAQITTSGMVTAPLAANCTVSEQTPNNNLIPQWFKNSCLPGGTAKWNDPLYSVNGGAPSPVAPSVTVTSGVQSVKVINGWHCEPNPVLGSGFQIQLFKHVVGPTLQVPQMTFVLTPNCNPASTPLSAPITVASGSSAGGGGAVSVPSGATCTLSETMPDPMQIPAMTAFCSAQGSPNVPQWQTPTLSLSQTGSPPLAQPMIVTASMNLFVTNTWACVPPPSPLKVKPKHKPKFRIHIGIPLPGLGGGGGSGQPGNDGPPPPPGRP